MFDIEVASLLSLAFKQQSTPDLLTPFIDTSTRTLLVALDGVIETVNPESA